MSRMFPIAVVAVALLGAVAPCHALDASSLPESNRTSLGLYLTAEEVPPLLEAARGRSLFVDVRTPEERKASGAPAGLDANAPLVDSGFAADIEPKLAVKGLTKADPVVLICRSGRRSALAANRLAEAGFTRVYTVVDGFEGAAGGGNGWKGSKLPLAPPN